MDVVVLQVFVSLLLAAGSVLLFAHSMKQRDHEHSERLALLPLDADADADADAGGRGPDHVHADASPSPSDRSLLGEDARAARGAETVRARGDEE